MLLFKMPVALAQYQWKLNSESDGIKVYSSSVPDSKIHAIKVECEFNASASQLVAVLLDVKTGADWVYHTKSASLIKQVSPSELYYYSEVDIPWPVQNRDFVAHLTVTQNKETKVVTVDGPAVDGLVDHKNGIVRINHSKGKWVITPKSDKLINVSYTLQVDPGGAIPAWLVNLFSSEGPLHSFRLLRSQLKKTAYRNASYSFIRN